MEFSAEKVYKKSAPGANPTSMSYITLSWRILRLKNYFSPILDFTATMPAL
jgi:hypothetical protein